MSKKFLARIAAAILATGLATTGVLAGSLGSANAAWDGHRRHKPPIVVTDNGGDGTGGGATTQRTDTGWG